MPPSMVTLKPPPADLAAGEVRLQFSRTVPADESRDLVPYYHFRILTGNDLDIGHINFRIGETDHVRLFAGHLGFEVKESFRGRAFAWQACCAIAPFVRSFYDEVVLTCDPDNHASRRTIEKLGARFLDEICVPPRASHCTELKVKRRYQWAVSEKRLCSD
jgi:tagatose 1,6-diphosphate aldolase